MENHIGAFEQGGPGGYQDNTGTFILLYYPLKLVNNTLLLMTPYILETWYREFKLELSWKLPVTKVS